MMTFAPMHPKDLKIDDFTYDLPDERIAYQPVTPRDSSKLLIYRKGEISDTVYRNLPEQLTPNDVLVFNDTRVIKSRIIFHKQTGAKIEVFCLEPHEENVEYALHFQTTGDVAWKCMVGNAAKWKGEILEKKLLIDGEEVMLYAELTAKIPDAYVVKFSWKPENISFGEVIEAAGNTPLPPYIKRKVEKSDEERYQTVYSSHEGSVAAPTAGLHFTDSLLRQLCENNTQTLFTTLHVGAGTFKPVKSNTMEGHVMHNEWMNISTTLLEQLKINLQNGKRIISVGTTSMRTLESIYWMGNKAFHHPEYSLEELHVNQWDPYQAKECVSNTAALEALIKWMETRQQTHIAIETGIIIAPGYTFRVVGGLITNFHQPKSTLLLLVSALVGEQWKSIYQYALGHDFRFLSYGDGSLLLP